MKTGIVVSILGLGFALVIFSSLWTTIFPVSASWNDAKAERNAQVKARMNEVSHLLLRPNTSKGVLQAELDQLTQENDQLNAEFTSVVDRPQTTSKYMKWTGISLVVVGICGWYAVNQKR